MNDQKEKLILENLISSKDIFARCISLLKPNYFSPEYRGVLTFVLEYFQNYHAIPHTSTIEAESGVKLKIRPVSKDEYNYTCDSIEKFCQTSALKSAILLSSNKVNSPDVNMGEILEIFKEVVTISLPKDLGINLYDNPEDKLRSFIETQLYLPTMIYGIDRYLDGGCARKQLTLFSANSGVGKSIMLANIGANYSKQGYKVLYLSLELAEPMVYLRLSSIVTGVSAKEWKEKIPEISHKISDLHENGAGDYIIKRIKNGSSANDIRSYLKTYEVEYGYSPDILIVDYLDIMHPNEGIKNLSISEQDKLKAEQLTELLHEYNCVGLSASQQNRDALNKSTPDQSGIAGGLSKVNAVDNYISIHMDPAMRLNGQMLVYFLKTRSSDGVGKNAQLMFNPNNLIICDSNATTTKISPRSELVIDNKNRRQANSKKKSRADEILNKIKNENMPEEKPETVQREHDIINDNSILEQQLEEIKREQEFNNPPEIKREQSGLDSLVDIIT